MYRYNPEQSPHPEQWLELDEQERIALVEDYHRIAQIELDNQTIHAVYHAIVENQIAQNLTSVVRAMTRLKAQGLSRHDAIHAIASVLAEHLHKITTQPATQKNVANTYDRAVDRLTAKRWLKG